MQIDRFLHLTPSPDNARSAPGKEVAPLAEDSASARVPAAIATAMTEADQPAGVVVTIRSASATPDSASRTDPVVYSSLGRFAPPPIKAPGQDFVSIAVSAMREFRDTADREKQYALNLDAMYDQAALSQPRGLQSVTAGLTHLA